MITGELKKEIIDILDNVIYWETCPEDYKTRINAIKQQLTIPVVSSFNLEIKDRDIATIEALHDTLLDKKVLGLNATSMKESRALTQRMYKALSKD
jgi:hypothetical protein